VENFWKEADKRFFDRITLKRKLKQDACHRRWREANKDKILRWAHIRRSAVHQGQLVVKSVVWEGANGICHVCCEPVTLKEATLEHVIPLSRGGRHTYKNTKVAHKKCNSRKGARKFTSACP